ncbi:MAG: DCC1-like thiol-disulfide oxidoreductase family protein [Candidatus Poseidoniaceae archaeon]|jgi:predicted DCC family thiol-disulfide oxidoreductase YuxK|tara:strand:+ start:8752 stop:9141 length:390 start_codon:yes stop_codon:yes gene_type:complete
MSEPDVLLMDGDCGLCTRSAVFLHPRLNDQQSLKFIAIESEEGQAIIATFPEKMQQADSVFLVRNGRPYMRSAAALRCLLYLKWHYRMLFPFGWIIPLPLRNIVYRLLAKYRHKFFAKPEMCIFPSLAP